ncbi:hypothetical protein SIN04_02825 [Methylocella tundrae]|nr:hypothetical protein SIN04_02825 [Methylocella tundrae]
MGARADGAVLTKRKTCDPCATITTESSRNGRTARGKASSRVGGLKSATRARSNRVFPHARIFFISSDRLIIRLIEPNSNTMTEAPKKSKRGGKRAGAGRKPKGYTPPSALSGLDLKAAAIAATPDEIESGARIHARTALESLKKVMLNSDSESARVAAANTILDRGFGKPSTDTGIDMALPLFDQVFLKTTPGEMMEEARKLAPLALAVLDKIAQNSPSDSARVSAARALLDRGLGAVSTARLESYRSDAKAIGKKDLASAAAASAGEGTDWGDDLNPGAALN